MTHLKIYVFHFGLSCGYYRYPLLKVMCYIDHLLDDMNNVTWMLCAEPWAFYMFFSCMWLDLKHQVAV